MKTKKINETKFRREDGVEMEIDDVGRCGRIYFHVPAKLLPPGIELPGAFTFQTMDFPTGGRGYLLDSTIRHYRRLFAQGIMPCIPRR